MIPIQTNKQFFLPSLDVLKVIKRILRTELNETNRQGTYLVLKIGKVLYLLLDGSKARILSSLIEISSKYSK